MAGITLAQAQENLDMWLDASAKVAKGQSYQIGTRAYRRADLREIHEMIKYWRTEVDTQIRTGGTNTIRCRPIIPLDY
jgi:hypothetical protein